MRGQWVVELQPGRRAAEEAPRLAAQYGGRVGHVYETVLDGFSLRASDEAAAALARNPNVKRVEADRVVEATATSLGVQRIGATDGTASGATGAGVKVAVLDTGVDAAHPALAGSLAPGYDCTGQGVTDGHGHGTHVAGTVTGAGVGVASNATVVPVKVLDNAGSGYWSWIICGIDWVTRQGTIKVANMSLGGSSGEVPSTCGSSSLHQAICNSVNAGVTYTVAAGNSAASATTFVPAMYPEVITVSAFEDANGVPCVPGSWCEERIASFSNYGTPVDVTAPGVNVTSSIPGGGYGSWNGTSMAAPHVAGVAALVLEQAPGSSPADVLARLRRTGECPTGGTATSTGSCTGTWAGDRDTVAEPLVNAPSAVTDGATTTPTNQPPTASFTHSCSGTTCTFDATGSSDADGDSLTYTWSFGGTGVTASTTFADGTHTVTLTVSDGTSTATSSAQVTVTAPAPSGITATVRGYKVKGAMRVDVRWTGATSAVDVYRNGTRIAAGTTNDGLYVDSMGKGGGTFTYKVCAAGSQTVCSAPVSVTF